MNRTEIQRILKEQREFFQSGATLSVAKRLSALGKLKLAMVRHEQELLDALKCDLGKSASEAYMCEVGLTLSEISYMQRHLRRLAREKRVVTPMAHYVSRSFVKPVPYGNVLIMSPWNYPLLLTIEPLVDALAAGNTCVLKPSAYSPATTQVIKRLVEECFEEKYVAVVTGGRAENSCLLEQKFDYIFFTGSQAVGKEVLRRAAEHLTPATLELGGKSPCVVDQTADLKVAARRIVFGKYLNCQESVKEKLLKLIREEIERQFGKEPLKNPDYGKIINAKHFVRISGLIDPAKVLAGGQREENTLRIAPTLMDHVTWDDPVMQEEIFGPVLPVLTYTSQRELMALLNSRPHPLAAYYFSRDKQRIRRFTESVQFGGGCINDTIIHLATSNMGFGGVGASGMGSYHGRTGFDTFSHKKSIVDKKTWLDLPMRYQPYKKLNDRLIKMFLK